MDYANLQGTPIRDNIFSGRKIEENGLNADSMTQELGLRPLPTSIEDVKLASNVGDVGRAPDYSDTQPASPLRLTDKLFQWLWNTPVSVRMRNSRRRGLAQMYKDDTTGVWMLMLPGEWYTLDMPDTAGECCWVPFDIGRCAANAPMALLCLKDCYELMDYFVNAIRYPGANDLKTYFQRDGESVLDARIRMARVTMAFMTIRNVILGVFGTETDNIKSFHGLVDVLSQDNVFHTMGGGILSAFRAIGCRINALNSDVSNYIISVNKITLEAIQEVIVPDIYGRVPAGWYYNSSTGEVRYKGIRFVDSMYVSADFEAGLGEAWLLNRNYVGVFLGGDLMPTGKFVRGLDTITNNPDNGCGEICTYYWNFGTVFTTNPNYLAVIQGIPLSTSCLNALGGLEALYTPDGGIAPRPL